MKTILLNSETWDLTLDTSGNIAVAQTPYALAQDAASAIKLFQGELYYDTTKGIPYWSEILGYSPPVPLMKAYFVAAAKTVPGVVEAVCYISSITDRTVSGQVQVTDTAGNISAASF